MQIFFFNVPYALMKVVSVLMRVYIDHNGTILDTNEWILSGNDIKRCNRPFQGFHHMSLICAMLRHKPVEEFFFTQTKTLITEVIKTRARKECSSP